jgi:hypothetical protein
MNITTELAKTLPNFYSMIQVQSWNRQNGGYFFEPSSMRFFSSRVHSDLYGGCVFVTSERNTYSNNPRAYTVRMITSSGHIETIGDFQGFSSRYGAHAYAKAVGDEIKAARK